MQRLEKVGVMVAALGVAVSGGVHLRLYLDGYRDIDIERLGGINIGRSFALSVVAAVLVAEVLVVAAIRPRLRGVASCMAVLYAAGALGAYAMTRTGGLLGFEESEWTPEALVAKLAEAAVVVLGGWMAVGSMRSRAATNVEAG